MSLPRGCANENHIKHVRAMVARRLHGNDPVQNCSGARARDVRHNYSREAYAPYPVRAGRNR